MGNRPSSLPTAQFCSASAALGTEHGAGRAAAISSCYHAMVAGESHADGLFARLAPDEQKEVMSKKHPKDVKITTLAGAEVTLAWRDDTWDGGCELPLVLYGEPEPGLKVAEPLPVITEGTADRVWVVDGTAYVADVKWTDWSSPDGLASLQLHAYALAACQRYDVDTYCLGIWNATEGEWDWGNVYDLMEVDVMIIAERVRAAADNTSGEYATGSHCHTCWSRLYCKEWMAPVGSETALASVASGDLVEPADLLKAIHQVKAYKDLLKLAEDTLKVHADRLGGIPDGEGKVWGPGKAKHRSSLNRAMLEEECPGIVERCTTRPEGHQTRYQWRKAK